MLKRETRRWPGLLFLMLALALVFSLVACQSQPAPSSNPPSAKKEAEAPKTSEKAAPAAAPANKPEEKSAAESRPAAPAKRYKVRMAQIYVAGALGPFWTTKDNGIFDKYGVDLEVVMMQGSAVGTAAIIAGNAEVMLTAPSDATIGAKAQGNDIVILGSLSNSLEYRLIVAPSIKSAADLKGKAVIISRPGGSDDRLMRLTLEKLGLDPKKDVQWMSIGALPDRLASMMGGQGVATAATPPTTLMFLKQGFKEMVNLADLNIPYIATTFHANGKWVKQNPDAAEAFLKAMMEGVSLYRTNKEVGMKALKSNMQIDDQEQLESTYQSTSAILQRDLMSDITGLRDQIDEAAAQNEKIKGLKPDDMVDFSLIKKIKASGFIDSLPWR